MRLIQTKLNTPTNSMENLDQTEEPEAQKIVPEVPKPKIAYRTPSINMGTWSERPKIPVNVKDDPDYHKYQSKLIANNQSKPQNNTVQIKHEPVKINGQYINGNPISTQNNVVIRIGEPRPFVRKPLGTVNTRPHSIAFGNDLDISRVPIVRSVELKKPYRDFQNNTSITQIYNNDQHNEVIKEKPVLRANTFNNHKGQGPVVRGFRDGHVKSWGQTNSFATLPAKNFTSTVNQTVPFSQSNLRRTESHKESNNNAPAPPAMPKFNGLHRQRAIDLDPKEQLLQAIRDFGGKKGLKSLKA